MKAKTVWLKQALSKASSKYENCRLFTILNGSMISQQVFTAVKTEGINYCCIPFERAKIKITFGKKKRNYHFTLCRKARNFTKRFHTDKFRIIYACILIKVKIYIYFCNNIVFFEGKTNISSFLWHQRPTICLK